MIDDPIVEKIRSYRKKHAEKFGNNLKLIVEDLRNKEKKSKHIFSNPGPKLLLKKTGS
ncbi:MAG: hypothetical protein U9P79_10100 [Candidatus Cloacimonadota bacterium]|nr:hypothetical protein [Candidatus Cloacimonadota bacterium]